MLLAPLLPPEALHGTSFLPASLFPRRAGFPVYGIMVCLEATNSCRVNCKRCGILILFSIRVPILRARLQEQESRTQLAKLWKDLGENLTLISFEQKSMKFLCLWLLSLLALDIQWSDTEVCDSSQARETGWAWARWTIEQQGVKSWWPWRWKVGEVVEAWSPSCLRGSLMRDRQCPINSLVAPGWDVWGQPVCVAAKATHWRLLFNRLPDWFLIIPYTNSSCNPWSFCITGPCSVIGSRSHVLFPCERSASRNMRSEYALVLSIWNWTCLQAFCRPFFQFASLSTSYSVFISLTGGSRSY